MIVVAVLAVVVVGGVGVGVDGVGVGVDGVDGVDGMVASLLYTYTYT